MPDHIFLGHTTANVVASVTRPADTVPYTAGDVVGTAVTQILDFADVARSAGGSGMLMGALLVDSANQATLPTFELWLFNAPPTVQVDNVAFAPSDADVLNLLAIVVFYAARIGNPAVGTAGNSAIQSDILSVPFKCAAATTHMYGVLVVRNAYTPIASELFTIRLTALQDY